MTESSETSKNAKRKWYQFSIRKLFVLTFIAGICFAFYFSAGRDQKLAVAWLKEYGGEVFYEHEYRFNADGELEEIPQEQRETWRYLPLPAFVKQSSLYEKWIGKDYEWNVISARVEMGLNDDSLYCPIFASFSQIKKLEIHTVEAKNLSTIFELNTIEDLSILSMMSADLHGIEKLTRLRKLRLRSLGEKGYSPVGKLTQLESLDVGEISVSDLSELLGLKKLKELRLYDAKHKHLELILNFKELEHLEFDVPKFGKINRLLELKNLKVLKFHGHGGISEEEFAEFKQQNPKCELSHTRFED